MHKKSRILYSTLSSPNTIPKFQPPPSAEIRDNGARKRNLKKSAVLQISQSQGSSQALPPRLPPRLPSASFLDPTISPRVSERFIEPRFANYSYTQNAPTDSGIGLESDEDESVPAHPHEALGEGQLGVRCRNSSLDLLGVKVEQDD